MNKEALIAAGLTEEQAVSILKMHQQAIDGTYIPKSTFEAEREKVKNLNTQLSDRDKQILELGAFKGTAEQLQTKVAELEKANKESKDKFEVDLLTAQKDAAIRLEITGKVVDTDDVVAKLDYTKVDFKDGKIVSGLTDQLDALKKSKPHYFPAEGSAADKGKIPAGWLFGNSPTEGGDTGKDKDKPNEAELFGKNLAASKVSSDTVAAKATEHYFK